MVVVVVAAEVSLVQPMELTVRAGWSWAGDEGWPETSSL